MYVWRSTFGGLIQSQMSGSSAREANALIRHGASCPSRVSGGFWWVTGLLRLAHGVEAVGLWVCGLGGESGKSKEVLFVSLGRCGQVGGLESRERVAEAAFWMVFPHCDEG